MPDFKYWTRRCVRALLQSAELRRAVQEGLREMQRQVGDLVLDDDGLACADSSCGTW